MWESSRPNPFEKLIFSKRLEGVFLRIEIKGLRPSGDMGFPNESFCSKKLHSGLEP